MKLYTPKQIYEPLGEGVRWLSYLVDKSIVRPHFDSGLKGVTKLYTPTEAMKAGLVKYLTQFGYSIDVSGVIAHMMMMTARKWFTNDERYYILMNGLTPVGMVSESAKPSIFGGGSITVNGCELHYDVVMQDALSPRIAISIIECSRLLDLVAFVLHVPVEELDPYQGDDPYNITVSVASDIMIALREQIEKSKAVADAIRGLYSQLPTPEEIAHASKKKNAPTSGGSGSPGGRRRMKKSKEQE